MNITISRIFFIVFCILQFFSKLNAQNECGDTRIISTNPDNPINEKEYPGPYRKLNRDLFDWRIHWIPIYCNSPYWNGDFTPESPLWTTQADFYHITYQDYKWEDGWELMWVVRGYVSETDNVNCKKGASCVDGGAPDPIPWLILYNRYLGKLRVFAAVKQAATFTGASISIKFLDGVGNIQTNLLNKPDDIEPLIALDKYIPNSNLNCISRYTENNTRWLYADFQMVYDP